MLEHLENVDIEYKKVLEELQKKEKEKKENQKNN